MNTVARIMTMCSAGLLLSAHASFGSSASLVNSYWSPADFDSGYGPGIKLQGSFNELYDIEFRTSVFPDMGEDVITEEGPVNVDLAVSPLELGFTLNFPFVPDPLVQSYFGGGIGYHRIDLSAKGPAGKIEYDVDNEIGFYLVGGARLHFTPALIMILEVMQRYVEGDAVAQVADGSSPKIDMNLNGLGVNIGLGLFW